MGGSVATTNVLIGVMAAMSVLQTMLIVGAGIAAFSLYRRVVTLIDDVDPREIRQAVTKVNEVLDAVRSTVDTAEAIGSGVQAKARWLSRVGRGLSVFVVELLKPHSRQRA